VHYDGSFSVDSRTASKIVDVPDVVRATSEVLLPVSSIPESESFRLFSIVAHGRVPVGSALEVEVDKFLEISSNDLDQGVSGVQSRRRRERTWSESTKITRSRSRGNSTSRKRIL
jgi:hypothetical protein